jgi:hypothetical protein
MKVGKLRYRMQQFRLALRADPSPEDLQQAQKVLTPALLALFLRLSPSEQAHSLIVFKKLTNQGEMDPDLLAAALLHDAGKSYFPLSVWERVLIVLGRAFFPSKAAQWGQEPTGGWPPKEIHPLVRRLRQPFVVAERHPEWGAALVEQAGGSVLAVSLVRRHQERLSPYIDHNPENILLHKLQSVDNES